VMVGLLRRDHHPFTRRGDIMVLTWSVPSTIPRVQDSKTPRRGRAAGAIELLQGLLRQPGHS